MALQRLLVELLEKKEISVIVNQIENPDQIIGIANGFGGVKNESALSTEERRSIELLSERVL